VRGPRSFVVSGHSNREEAEAALAALEDLGRNETLRLADAAIVVRTKEGRVEL